MLLVLLAGLVVGGWIGGETLLARTIREAIASDPRLQATRVSQLREPDRIGVRVRGFTATAPEGTVAADWVDIFLPPSSPDTLHVTVAPGATLTGGGRELVLGPDGAEAWASFSPTNSLALSHARVLAEDAVLDGAAAVGRIDLAAELAGYGADAPRATGAAYDVSLAVADLSLDALSGGAVTGVAGAEGTGRLWLDRVPVRAAAPSGDGVGPRIVGFRVDGLDLALDDLAARIYGRVVADAEGRAEGEILVDTADSRGFVERAAAVGLLPERAAPLAATILTAVAQTPAAAEPAAEPRPAAWPEPHEGAARITVAFRDGQSFLGPLPIGPAPRLYLR
ncbi:DUF2125 domain-containing protein [Paracoccus sp. S-4012]|uniref:DUF2125 domain-containing protein n=1 Tax=Paracoccus sp. S-4012 TaxID=2665648 RepID=UPI0018A1EE56|nr:DUF2125 domain-containing protein [Paracoccus sp. S-4012]